MFKNNVGMVDRVIRVVVGIALLAAFFLVPDSAWRYALLIGIVPLVTGLFGTCLIYSILGISTNSAKQN